MENTQTLDNLFHQAVSAIDAGDESILESLLLANPELVRERLVSPGAWLRNQVGAALDGFFRQPYLLWFVAEDPVRSGKLPGNIAAITRMMIEIAKREKVDNLKEQLDYTLRLVAWSVIARNCRVQIGLIDVLVDAGATPGFSNDALVNANFAAAEHLVERGGQVDLCNSTLSGALGRGYPTCRKNRRPRDAIQPGTRRA